MAQGIEASNDSSVRCQSLTLCHTCIPEYTHLFACYRVLHKRQERQLLETSEHLQIRQLGHIVLRQDQGAQRRHALDNIRLNPLNPIPCAQKRLQSRALREVGEEGDVVVGEINAFLIARGSEVLNGGDLVACG